MSEETADVAVIGGGPSGVAAAVELRRRGAGKIVILEREGMLGGATRHCSHSPFGMREFGRIYFGESYGHRLEREAEQHGVDIRTGHSVVRLGDDGRLDVASQVGVSHLRARRVLITTGAREQPRAARLIPGDRPIGIVTTGTLQAYVAFHGLMPFRRPVILGSELVTMSAVLTCLSHGARPAAVIEPRQHALVRKPFSLFPTVMGIPFLTKARIVDVIGQSRVEAVKIIHEGLEKTFACDGLLLTGEFTPETGLLLQSAIGVDRGSNGPAVDQAGRLTNPIYFAGGNVLRAVETGGWAFREGRALGVSLAADLERMTSDIPPVSVQFEDPIKLVVPSLIRPGELQAVAFRNFQLRFTRRARGHLCLEIEGRTVWEKRGLWSPERRILVPIPDQAFDAHHIRFRFREER